MRQDKEHEEKSHVFDRPENVKRFLWGLYVCCGLLIAVDWFVPVHGAYGWEQVPGFYAAFGFVSFVGIVLFGKHVLRRIVKRDEDYYD